MKIDKSHAATNREEYPGFLRSALTWKGSVTPRVLPHLVLASFYPLALVLLDRYWLKLTDLNVTPFEYTGAVLGLVLVFRTNAGHDRWWEARKLWGGIVNQSRNIMLAGLTYGPEDQVWRKNLVKWTVAFSFSAKESLRQSHDFENLEDLLAEDEIQRLKNAPHKPLFVAGQVAGLLHQARLNHQLGEYAFLELERQRALLIDYIGGCERILKTPMPLVYAIKTRRFIFLFLLLLPFSFLDLAGYYSIPIFLLVAYPLFSLDRIGLELQNPFATQNLSHLPLEAICATVKSNGLALITQDKPPGERILGQSQ
ncbi:MAG: bestrophin family protein [Gammaproteobacteria bacterium]